MVDSEKVSRPGNEQYLVVEDDDGTEHEAEMRTVVREENGEQVERDEYAVVDEDVPDAVAAEIDRVNEELAQRGADQEDVDQEDVDDVVDEEVTPAEEAE